MENRRRILEVLVPISSYHFLVFVGGVVFFFFSCFLLGISSVCPAFVSVLQQVFLASGFGVSPSIEALAR